MDGGRKMFNGKKLHNDTIFLYVMMLPPPRRKVCKHPMVLFFCKSQMSLSIAHLSRGVKSLNSVPLSNKAFR